MPRPRYWWIPARLKPYLRPIRDRLRRSLARAGLGMRGSIDPAFCCAVDPIPEQIGVGQGTTLLITGYCFHLSRALKRVEVRIDRATHRTDAWGMPRSDIRDEFSARAASPDLPFYSGFWVSVPLPGVTQPRAATISIVGHFEGGVRRSLHVATPTLLERPADAPSQLTLADFGRAVPPTVAICMATYNPPLDLFRAQIESIQAQTLTDWICIISDDCSRPDIYRRIEELTASDDRFVIVRGAKNLGFYHNFERCLWFVPNGIKYIALADQDDVWYCDKLSVLISAMQPDVSLAFSDMRIVNQSGSIVATSFWFDRPNTCSEISTLLIDNAITGAVSLFRAELLKTILPFPPRAGNPFHDHWIGCAALTAGKVRYIPRPLQDYIQHGANVIGFPGSHAHPRRDFFRAALSFLRAARRMGTIPTSQRSYQGGVVGHWRAVYFWDVIRVQLFARTLLVRAGFCLDHETRRALRRIASLDSTSSVWFAARATRRLLCGRGWLSGEPHLLRGVLWRQFACQIDGFVQPVLEWRPDRFAAVEEPGARLIHDIRYLTAPLKLRVVPKLARRVNILVQTLDWNYFFGGYITTGAFALRLAAAGWNVRLVVLGGSPQLDAGYRKKLEQFQDLEDLFSKVEVVSAVNRNIALSVSMCDVFVATTAWTAHVANAAMVSLGKRPFVFIIGEYEPFVHPNGTLSAMVRQAYMFRHDAIFSSQLLCDYFEHEGLGVFAAGREFGAAHSTVLRNPITDVGTINVEDLRRRGHRRLLFYARPEEHAARNMFELGVMALAEAIRRGAFGSSWEFFGVGAIGESRSLELPGGRRLTILPRQDQGTYAALLREHDLGLCLMDTPHPSLVPIEMATAGMVVVTTTYANKTAEALRGISCNIIGVAPTIEGVVAGLGEAVSRTDDFEARVKGSNVSWPRSAREAFDDAFLDRFRQFADES